MDTLSDLIKIVLPAALVLYAMYLVIRSFLQKDFDRQVVALKQKNAEVVLPIRLQAYERMALFLERISPNNMLIRLADPTMTAAAFQQLLLTEIRDEFHHNHSQQIYMSDDAWQVIRNAMNATIAMIQSASEKMKPEDNAVDLSSAIFKEMMEQKEDHIGMALSFVKNEIRQSF
jgi:hypothetical protein